MNARAVLIRVAIGCAGINAAAAAPVPYTFSTGTSNSSMISEFLGSSVSGTFMYDPAAMQTGTTPSTATPANAALYGGHLLGGVPHSSYTALNASVSGGSLGSTVLSFNDPRGSTVVSNGGFPNPPGSDFMSLDAEPFGAFGTHNISLMTFAGYQLWNMRMFWSSDQGFATDNQNLPALLPGVSPRIALDFVEVGNTSGTPLSFVFYDNVVLSPLAAVPEPETYALMLAGFGLLGFAARRRMTSSPAISNA